jgi:hypothetical protein
MSAPGSKTPLPPPFRLLRVPPTCSAGCAAWECPSWAAWSRQDKLRGSQPPCLPLARPPPSPSRRRATTAKGPRLQSGERGWAGTEGSRERRGWKTGFLGLMACYSLQRYQGSRKGMF